MPEPLVTLHGWGMHPGFLAPLAERLTGRAVQALSLPGHGARAHEAQPVDPMAPLIYLADAAAAQAPPAAAWLGWSLGGMAALDLAARAPARITRLVLIAASPRFVTAPDWPHAVDPAVLEAFGAQLAEEHAATLQRFLALQARGAREDARILRERLAQAPAPAPWALALGLAALRGADLRARLAAVRQPVLLIGGERDTLAPPAALEAAAHALPDARLRVLPRAGHAPFVTDPERVAQWVQEFLDE